MMKSNKVDTFFSKYWWMDTCNIVKEIEQKREQEKMTERDKYLSSIIYKISLYNFSDIMPKYLMDSNFNDIFKFERCVFVNVIDKHHVKEIKTGIVFPILNLSKNNDHFESSYIEYNLKKDEYSKFAISKNNVLECKKAKVDELIQYLKIDENVIENYINGVYDNSEKKVKTM